MTPLFNLKSRVTQLTPAQTKGQELYLPSLEYRDIWVLRDDELGGFWGSKYRKYSSIIRHCIKENITHIICTGGINSNNLAAAAVLCTEFKINMIAFAIDDHHTSANTVTGNRLILQTALPPDQLLVVPRSEKSSVSEQMKNLSAKLTAAGKKNLVLEEGGGCIAAVHGCLTLADEIFREREEWPDRKTPDHIFVDSGTGLTAAGLLAGMHLNGSPKNTKIHLVQMAGFDEQIQNAFSSWVTPATNVTWTDVNHMVKVYRPLSPRSYGATSAALFTFINEMARTFGILTDPVYTAKLFARAFDLIEGQNLKGRILIIHTGGLSGLLGFNLQALNQAPT